MDLGGRNSLSSRGVSHFSCSCCPSYPVLYFLSFSIIPFSPLSFFSQMPLAFPAFLVILSVFFFPCLLHTLLLVVFHHFSHFIPCTPSKKNTGHQLLLYISQRSLFQTARVRCFRMPRIWCSKLYGAVRVPNTFSEGVDTYQYFPSTNKHWNVVYSERQQENNIMSKLTCFYEEQNQL